MGTDIYVIPEYRVRGAWRLHPQIQNYTDEHPDVKEPLMLGRNYNLFNAVAGVRGHPDDAMFFPRGLPEDVLPETKASCCLYGGHSETWLTLDEFAECWAFLKRWTYPWREVVRRNYANRPRENDFQDQVWHSYSAFLYEMLLYLDQLQADSILLGTDDEPECRLVFWFD